MVTGCPPVALLALIELLNYVLTHRHTETTPEKITETLSRPSETDETVATRLSPVSPDPGQLSEPTIEQRMWAYFVTERSKGRIPTGAELDRAFSTNNYGRGVLRKWRDDARLPPKPDAPSCGDKLWACADGTHMAR